MARAVASACHDARGVEFTAWLMTIPSSTTPGTAVLDARDPSV
jgi:hypothetical protein